MAEKGSVKLGKSLLAGMQSRTRRAQSSADKKFYATLGLGAWDAYQTSAGAQAVANLYDSHEGFKSQLVNDMDNSFNFLIEHKKLLNPKGTTTGGLQRSYTPDDYANALLDAEINNRKFVHAESADRRGDLEVNWNEKRNEVKNSQEWKDYIDKYTEQLEEASRFNFSGDIPTAEDRIRYAKPLDDKLKRIAREVSSNYGIIPSFLKLLGVGTNTTLVTKEIRSRSGDVYEVLLPENMTPAQEKLTSYVKSRLESGAFDDADIEELAELRSGVSGDLNTVRVEDKTIYDHITDRDSFESQIGSWLANQEGMLDASLNEDIFNIGGKKYSMKEIFSLSGDSSKAGLKGDIAILSSIITGLYKDKEINPDGTLITEVSAINEAVGYLIERERLSSTGTTLSTEQLIYKRLPDSEIQNFYKGYLPELMQRLIPELDISNEKIAETVKNQTNNLYDSQRNIEELKRGYNTYIDNLFTDKESIEIPPANQKRLDAKGISIEDVQNKRTKHWKNYLIEVTIGTMTDNDFPEDEQAFIINKIKEDWEYYNKEDISRYEELMEQKKNNPYQFEHYPYSPISQELKRLENRFGKITE